jgi:hypothetical protein
MRVYTGLLFVINNHLALDFYFGKGINNDAGKEGYSINLGATFTF